MDNCSLLHSARLFGEDRHFYILKNVLQDCHYTKFLRSPIYTILGRTSEVCSMVRSHPHIFVNQQNWRNPCKTSFRECTLCFRSNCTKLQKDVLKYATQNFPRMFKTKYIRQYVQVDSPTFYNSVKTQLRKNDKIQKDKMQM